MKDERAEMKDMEFCFFYLFALCSLNFALFLLPLCDSFDIIKKTQGRFYKLVRVDFGDYFEYITRLF